MTFSPDLTILRWLARRTHAAAPTIGTTCAMAPGEVRAHLSALESRRLVASRQEKDAKAPRRVFYVTAEGRRAGSCPQGWCSFRRSHLGHRLAGLLRDGRGAPRGRHHRHAIDGRRMTLAEALRAAALHVEQHKAENPAT